jgi:hypothetical protein
MMRFSTPHYLDTAAEAIQHSTGVGACYRCTKELPQHAACSVLAQPWPDPFTGTPRWEANVICESCTLAFQAWVAEGAPVEDEHARRS